VLIERECLLEELGITASLFDTLQLSIGLFGTMSAEALNSQGEKKWVAVD
jgi:hypothetical protein